MKLTLEELRLLKKIVREYIVRHFDTASADYIESDEAALYAEIFVEIREREKLLVKE